MIDTKLLRQKILDLAIRGKLVPQDPKDEPASELLKKIKAEKEALIKVGKLKRDKHESFIFRGDDKRYYEQIDGKNTDISGEIPFNLPKGWAWCRLNTIAMGFQYGTSEKSFPDGKVAVLRMGNLQNGEIIYDNLVFTSNAEEIAQYQLVAGDLLFNRTNSAEHVGKTSIYRGNQDAIFAGYLVRFHPISCSSDFINYVMNSSYHHHFCQSVKSDAVNQSNINAQKLSRFLFPLPPLSEQKRIVTQIESLLKCVDEIDKESETLEKSITLAKQKILDLAIRGKLVPQDPDDEPASELLKKIKAEKEALIKAGKLKRDKHESFIFRGDDNCYHENIDGKVFDITEEIPFVLPQGWEWVRLSSIADFDLGKTLDRVKNQGRFHKYLRSVNVLWGEIDLSNVKEMRFEDSELERYSIKRGDLLICEGGDVGRCAVWNESFCYYYQNALHRVRFFQNCQPIFYQYVMMFFENIGLLKEISQGVTIKHLTKNTLNSMIFPLPPLAEQKRIVSQVEKLFSILETMRG